VVTLLRSYLPHRQRGAAARAVGVSPSYLSRVLSDWPYGVYHRLEPLSPVLAARLADWLHLDVRSRHQLLEHADLSDTSHVKAREAACSYREIEVILPELLTLHAAANRELNPALASQLFTGAYGIAKQFIETLPPCEHPLEFAQVSLVLNDLEAVLDLNVEGIYHARLAAHWAKAAGTKGSNLLGKDADDLWGNALFAEAVSTHNLGLEKEARFLSSEVFTKRINMWSGEAALALLKYTAFAQRTSLRQVDMLSDQYREAVETFGSGTDQTTTRLAFSEAKLRAYLACPPTKASLMKAESALEQCLSETATGESEENRVFARISQIGVLSSVIFLNTYSQLLRARGDAIRAEKVRAEAESRANRAGLAHQLARIRAGSPFTTRRFQNANQRQARHVDKAVGR
jgi:hypothetical protein